MREMNERIEAERKPTGILWKLSPEEREALREVCHWAMIHLNDIGCRSGHVDVEKINQLLGEEK
jgi:hypothetical protein